MGKRLTLNLSSIKLNKIKMIKKIFALLICICMLPSFTTSHLDNKNALGYNTFYNLIDTQGITFTLNTVEHLYEQGNLTSDQCHLLLHHLGDYASTKFGLQQSMQEATEICRAGFIHGLFLSADLREINNTKICTQSSFHTLASRLQCLHGLGHGLSVFFDYNLTRALDICKVGESADYQSACATGVFMEEFSPRAHLSAPANSKTFEMCDEHDFTSECNWYVGIRIIGNSTSLSGGIQGCKRAKVEYQSDCERGFGVMAAGRTDYNRKKIITICADVKACLMGAASEFGLSREILRGLLFCHHISPKNRRACVAEIINSYSKHF